MSAIYNDARVFVAIADYGVAEAKINAIGLGVQIVGLAPNGLTPPHSVIVMIDLPQKHAGTRFSLSIELRDTETNALVKLPTPTGGSENLRISQVVDVNRPTIPGLYLPDSVPCRVQIVASFTSGLPLALGRTYKWRVDIDGETRKHWTADFHVAGPPPQPVLGGPDVPEHAADLPRLNDDES